jgi:hypothetical protein
MAEPEAPVRMRGSALSADKLRTIVLLLYSD